jgi:hypothetical protein
MHNDKTSADQEGGGHAPVINAIERAGDSLV